MLNNEEFYQGMMDSHSSPLLHSSIKNFIKEFLDMINEEYYKVIDIPDCHESDAIQFIVSFTIMGLLVADTLDITMEEYFKLTEIMVVMLDLVRDENDTKTVSNKQETTVSDKSEKTSQGFFDRFRKSKKGE